LVVQVSEDDLAIETLKGELPKVSEAQEAVKRGQCHALAGTDRSSEP
jgi:hypothetical protein